MAEKFYFEIKKQKQSDFTFLTSNSLVSVVDFYSSECPPCRALSPKLSKYGLEVLNNNVYLNNDENIQNIDKEKLSKSVVFLKVNIDENPELTEMFDIQTIPHIVFFHKGKLTEKIVHGDRPKEIIIYAKNLIEN